MKTSFFNIKFLLTGLIILLIGGILTLFIGYRFVSSTPELVISAINRQASMTISKLQQDATRDGIKEWHLEAGSARLEKAGKIAILEDIAVTFFLKNNRRVLLTANKGILNTDSNDFEVSGEVMIQDRANRLTSDKLQYEHKRRIIVSPLPVRISSDMMAFTASRMTFDLTNNQTVLEGNVEGTIQENVYE